MKREINSLTLINTCVNTNIDTCNYYMNGSRSCSGRLLRKKIKHFLPELYNELCLDYPNPYESQCRYNSKLNMYIYVHSMIEYFIEIN